MAFIINAGGNVVTTFPAGLLLLFPPQARDSLVQNAIYSNVANSWLITFFSIRLTVSR